MTYSFSNSCKIYITDVNSHLIAKKAYREAIRYVFGLAKVRSPIGDITNGLKLILMDIENV